MPTAVAMGEFDEFPARLPWQCRIRRLSRKLRCIDCGMGMTFRHPHRVTYADCTVGNHIYYGNYLQLLEAARGEFFRQLGVTLLQWQERDVIFPVLECHLRYKAAARYDDVLQIEVWPTTAERIRLSFGYRIMNQNGKLILEAETQHVCASLNDKPKRLPEELIATLQPFLPVQTV